MTGGEPPLAPNANASGNVDPPSANITGNVDPKSGKKSGNANSINLSNKVVDGKNDNQTHDLTHSSGSFHKNGTEKLTIEEKIKKVEDRITKRKQEIQKDEKKLEELKKSKLTETKSKKV